MSVNVVFEKLNDFRVYMDGTSDLKGVVDITLPSFEHMTESVKGAGIAGEYESPNIGHFQSMKITLNWRVFNYDLSQLLAPVSRKIDCRGATQKLDAATGKYVMEAVRVLIQGTPTKVEPGKLEKGSPYEASTEIEATYIKIDIDGRNVVELDKLNYKYVVNGTDYLAGVRKALGM
ncbi:Phage tail tube protein FII [Anoxybacillus sp. BCO1]|nr:Phage tail tube protein FII [Anoxybacillus sp. BCO1]